MNKYNEYEKEELIKIIEQQENELKYKKYGLVWDTEREPEQVVLDCENFLPILKHITSNTINTCNSEDNILIEGDNYHALSVLNYTHKEKIDVIYIDPPYNTGEKDFKYNDSYVDKEDSYRHSKWLSFIEKRLNIAKEVLSKDGIIIVHIDEHESNNLYLLLSKVFGEKNSLGTIIWNKKNPKGDSKGVSVMHESILCFAKNKEKFLALENVLRRKKPNAEAILRKASQLYRKISRTVIPDDVKEVIKPFNYPKETLKDFEVTYNLELVNKEFQNWLNKQEFSNGEKAYKFIDSDGEVYQSVSMAWPNKKPAPEDYFLPLIHPVTNRPCPIPARGWRNPPVTMQRLLLADLILFGTDEMTQPRRKYLLRENMFENTNSLYENGNSDDSLFTDMGLDFAYPKPVSAVQYLIASIYPQAQIICDFMAGSGTTAHAVLELNRIDGGNRKFILCTNNENNICTDVTYPRISNIINGYARRSDGEQVEGLGGNLQYFQTDLLKKSNNRHQTKLNLTSKCAEMLCVKENIFNIFKSGDDYKIYSSHDNTKYLCIYFNTIDDSFDEFIVELKNIDGYKLVYMFSDDLNVDKEPFKEIKNCNIGAIPQKILDIYKQLIKMNIPIKPLTIFTDLAKAKKRVFIEKEKDDGASKLRIVLEKTIQKIAQNSGIAILKPNGKEETVENLNNTLKHNGVFSKVTWQENQTYMAIGNHAAHGDYDEYDLNQVENFYRYTQSLIDGFNIG
ncbi:site-specific DNA-methyltransferase [Sulfurimonas sp.]|uniref:site-specific DNA-methyltransferase n=1 Tax=Sulfurimonas sp. TaxID=2022749 RepID=UPI0019D876A5|nr:site-specific DNA-methyltransferase [Sulfurimonas sp.]MBE0515490.1 site-specific DNA-methyltransferase [Sulfurimonas sp.]